MQKKPKIREIDNRVLHISRNSSTCLRKYVKSEDDALINERGIAPKSALFMCLREEYGYSTEEIEFSIQNLVDRGRIRETPGYVFGEIRDRTRPIATNFNIARPRVPREGRTVATYRVYNKDRHLLWEAAANSELTGSQGEAKGLYVVLQFLRQPRILRLFRLSNPNFNPTELSR